MTPANGEGRPALIAGLACYGLWGVAPLAFQAMGREGADAWEIMAHRSMWAVFWAAILVWLARQTPEALRVFRQPRTMLLLAASTGFIAVNWSLFVWAVNNGRTLDTSLGYYINPLLNMAAGAVFFRERIDRIGMLAIAAAAVGVVLQGFALGHLPWISLILGFSFATYGVIRKQISVDAQTGLFVECLYLFLPALGFLLWLHAQGGGHFFDDAGSMFWLAAAGPITVAPLALFAWAARRMPLSTMGFLQFIAPTISFTIGVSQGEPLSALRIASFVFIWSGAAIYAWSALRKLRAGRAEEAPCEPVVPCEPGLPEDGVEARAARP
ncbi:MAG TPA: EamA family transporter RarD [Caulobacteraceae bacterium]